MTHLRAFIATVALGLCTSAVQADTVNDLFLVFTNNESGEFGFVGGESSGETYTVINFGAVEGVFPGPLFIGIENVGGLPNLEGKQWFTIGSFAGEGFGNHVILSNAPGSPPSSIDLNFENGLFAGVSNLDGLSEGLGGQGGFDTNIDALDFWSFFAQQANQQEIDALEPGDYADVVNMTGAFINWNTKTTFSRGMGIEEISIFPNPFVQAGTLSLAQVNGDLTGVFVPVPEPSALLLLLGAFPLVLRRRRRVA